MTSDNSVRRSVHHFGPAAVLSLFALIGSARAIVLTGQVSDLGGGRLSISYELSNDSLAAPVEAFSIFFDPNIVAPIAVTDIGVPADWDPLVFGPDPILAFDEIVVDFFALGGGIAPGNSLGGFVVEVSLLAGSTLGAQDFDVVDATSFAVLFSGSVVFDAPENPIPLPPAAMLFAAPLLLLRRAVPGVTS